MRLLQISDIHFKWPNCSNPDTDPERPYRTALLRDVAELVHQFGSIDAIIISGDIAFKGAAKEYEEALNWIRELSGAAQCTLEKVFSVPGNHDVDRSVIQGARATQNVHRAIRGCSPNYRETELRSQMQDEDTGRALFAPIAAYNDFAKFLNCQVFPTRPYWRQDLPLEHGVTLRLHGLTSTLLSGAEGADDTRESLYLSPLQTVLETVDGGVNLVISHHPPDWFMDRDDVEDAICGGAALQMFGHVHRQRIVRDPSYVRFSAGAVNPDRGELGWMPGYNLVELDVSRESESCYLEIEAHLRQWQSNPNLFRPVLTPEGEDVFRHRIRIPGRWAMEGASSTTSRAHSVPEGVPAEQHAATSANAAFSDGEGAMGDSTTRNLVYRFWCLKVSERREIALGMGLIDDSELPLPEPERYGRALIRASDRGLLDALADEIAKKEAH